MFGRNVNRSVNGRRLVVGGAGVVAAVGVAAGAAASTVPDSDSSPATMSVEIVAVEGSIVSISPDGTLVAGTDDDGRPCIWPIDGGDPACTDEPVAVANLPLYAGYRWAPDSSAVTFTADLLRTFHEPDVLVLERDGTLRNLTDDGVDELDLGDETSGAELDLAPTWTADGAAIVFSRSTNRGEATVLMTVPAAGGEATPLSDPIPGSIVVWTPVEVLADGSLLFVVGPPDLDDENAGIWRLDAGATEPELLRHDDVPGADAGLWSTRLSGVTPDGSTALAYNLQAIGRGTAEGAFWTVDLTTGEAAPSVWLDLAAGITVPAPDGPRTETFSTTGPAAPYGPQAFGPDGTWWVGVFGTTPSRQVFNVVDTATGELLGSLPLESSDVRIAGAEPQITADGTIMVPLLDGRAALFHLADGALGQRR